MLLLTMTSLSFSYILCIHEPFLNFLCILMIFLLWHLDPKTSHSEGARFWDTTYGNSKLHPPIIPVSCKHFHSNGTPKHNHFPWKFRPLSYTVLHANLYPRLPLFFFSPRRSQMLSACCDQRRIRYYTSHQDFIFLF